MITAMGATNTGLMTFEEFERLPDHEEGFKLELLDGELIRMPPPERTHMEIAHYFLQILYAEIRRRQSEGKAQDLGNVYVEMGYRLQHHWFIPNVSITHAGQAGKRYFEGAPALAVEIISDSNTAKQMHKKVVAYFENGAREVWVVYPDTRSVIVHRGKTSTEVSATLITDLLPGFSIDLAEVFGAG